MASTNSKSQQSKLSQILRNIGAIYLIVIAAFAWGYLSFKNKVFPYQVIQDMKGTLESLKAQSELRENPRSAHEILNPVGAGGVTINKLNADQDDLIFVTWFRDGRFVADLIDRQGNVIYKWRIPHGEVDLSQAKDRAVVLFVRNQTIHGAHLSANGDVLLVIEYHGMIKLDRHSKVLWRTEQANHHAVTVAPDGSIWSLSRRELKDKKDWVAMAAKPYVDDTVVHYSADGKLIEEFSVAALIEKNRYEAIMYAGPARSPRLSYRDPLHINDINVLTEDQASHFPNTKSGDLMLSLRTPNTVIIVDPVTRDIKWSMTGPYLRQHDPQITRDGLMLVYDNRTTVAQLGGNSRYLTAKQKLGYSRLIAIDPVSREIEWEYQGTPEKPFYSSIQGKHEELANGNVLAVEPEGGRIFEVDRGSGDIVWEYINLLEPDFVGRVTQAIPFRREQLPFLGEATATPEQTAGRLKKAAG